MPVSLKSAATAHAVIQRDLSAMSEGRMPQVVAKARRLNETEWRNVAMCWVLFIISVKLAGDAASYLRDFERVRKARSIKIAVAEIQNLRLSLQAAERTRMHDASIIHIERTS